MAIKFAYDHKKRLICKGLDGGAIVLERFEVTGSPLYGLSG
jgi:hypothetical protein